MREKFINHIYQIITITDRQNSILYRHDRKKERKKQEVVITLTKPNQQHMCVQRIILSQRHTICDILLIKVSFTGELHSRPEQLKNFMLNEATTIYNNI